MTTHRIANGILALTLLLAAACSDGGATASTTGPTPAQTTDVTATLTDEVETDLSNLLVQGASSPSFSIAQEASPFSALTPACVAPNNTTDTDNDGVADDATYQFTTPPCGFTSRRGGTVGVTGTLRIQDPTPTAGFAYNSTLTNLSVAYTGGTRAYTVTRSGTRNVSASGTGLALASALTLQRTFASGATAAVTKQWTVAYTPATGAILVRAQPLPSGTLTVSGTYGWTRGAESFSLTVNTPVALSYDAACTQAPQIIAGELRAQGSYNGTSGYLRVRWSACGVEPTVVFLPL